MLRANQVYQGAKSVLNRDAARQWRTFDRLRARYYEALWEQAAQAIGAGSEPIGYGYLRIQKGDRFTFVNQHEVMLDDHLSLRIAGHKPLSYQLLRELGVPTPPYVEYDIANMGPARAFLRGLDGAGVVKPARGTGGGRGITTEIHSHRSLRHASLQASAYDTSLILEQEIAGSSYRMLYLGGEYVDAVRRDPPVVVGDGRSTIKQLIREENGRRGGGDEITALSPLTMDLDSKLRLRQDGLTAGFVPARAARIVVKSVVNQNSSRENHLVRESVHDSIIQMGRHIVAALGLPLVGMDIITRDISRPLDETGGVVNEINTTPGLHLHTLVAEVDQSALVAVRILEHIFQSTPARSIRTATQNEWRRH